MFKINALLLKVPLLLDLPSYITLREQEGCFNYRCSSDRFSFCRKQSVGYFLPDTFRNM